MTPEAITAGRSGEEGYVPGIENTPREVVWEKLASTLPEIFGESAENDIKRLFKGAVVLGYSDKEKWHPGDILSVEAEGVALGGASYCNLRIFEIPKHQKHYVAVTFRDPSTDRVCLSWDLRANEQKSESIYINFTNNCDMRIWEKEFEVQSTANGEYKENFEFKPTQPQLNRKGKGFGGGASNLLIKEVQKVADNLVKVEWLGFPSKGSYCLTLPIGVTLNI